MYKNACKNWSKKAKLSAKEYANCVQNPLIASSDNTKVIDIFPVMELHVYTGNFNRLFNIGDTILTDIGSSFFMGMWAESVNLERPELHSGQFTGNQCTKLLDNLEKLEMLSSCQDIQHSRFTDLISCFRALKVFSCLNQISYTKMTIRNMLLCYW